MNTSRRSHLRLLLATMSLSVFGISTNSKEKAHMDEQTFWQLIEAAKVAAGPDLNGRPQSLERALTPFDLDSLRVFQKLYEGYLLSANRWDLWGAAYIMNGGCSDDGFKYFRDWLISEGRTVFEGALISPESLVTFARRDYFELESFGYTASHVFSKKGGGELERDFNVEIAAPKGKEWNESDLPSLFPKLAAKYQLK